MFDLPTNNGRQAGGGASRFGNNNDVWSREPSEDSTAKIKRMGYLLNQKLGPEYLSTRQGPGGSKLTYLEGWRSISLANEVFGFNGWSSAVRDISIDFLDYNEETGRWNVHVTALVRITLPDGCYHEDVGCGKMDNCKSKADALDKVKKEAVTDAIKRALRNFGNLMGNCIYDKSFLGDIAKVKAPGKVNLDFASLHRPGQEYDEDGKIIKPDAVKPPPVAGPSNAVPSPQQNAGNQLPNQNGNKPQSNNAQNGQRQNIPPVQNKPQIPAQRAPQQVQPNQQQQRPNQYQPQNLQQVRPNPPQAAAKTSKPPNQNNANGAHQPQMKASTSAAVHLRPEVNGDPNKSLDSEDMLYDDDMGEEDESVMQGADAKYDDSGFEEGNSMLQGVPEIPDNVNSNNFQQSRNDQNNSNWNTPNLQQKPQLPIQRQQQPLRPLQSAANPPVQPPRPAMPSTNGQGRPQAPQQAVHATNAKQEPQMTRAQTIQEKTHVRKTSAENGQISAVTYRQQVQQEQIAGPDMYSHAQTQPAHRSGQGRSSGNRPNQAQAQGSSPIQRLQSQFAGGGPAAMEPTTYSSAARGTKRPHEQSEQPQMPGGPANSVLQSAQQQGIKRAMSPSERARQAELQAQQQQIAQNRQAAIEKRQKLNARSSGNKPVSA